MYPGVRKRKLILKKRGGLQRGRKCETFVKHEKEGWSATDRVLAVTWSREPKLPGTCAPEALDRWAWIPPPDGIPMSNTRGACGGSTTPRRASQLQPMSMSTSFAGLPSLAASSKMQTEPSVGSCLFANIM